MSENTVTPKVKRRRRISSVWMVPVIALILAGWLLWKNRIDQGPLITVSFETAEGIVAEKTEVRCKSVKVGIVEKVLLSDDLNGVVAEIRMDPGYEALLKKKTRFWVVRPRVSSGAISGLGTLITGAYIELDPAEEGKTSENFTGLEEPPVKGNNVPGLRLTLIAEEAGPISVGSVIYYRGFVVGQVERSTLDIEARRVKFQVFIEEEYAALVRKETRFWNATTFNVSAGATGFNLQTPSLQSLVSGGASFSTPQDRFDSPVAENGDVFTLYTDEKAAIDASFTPDKRVLLLFDQSVRGLERGSSVEYRGIPFGRVVDISLKYLEKGDPRVPVLVEVDTNAFKKASSVDQDTEVDLQKAVANGLRARLAYSSLITSSLYVDLDFYDDVPPESLTQLNGYDVIPTRSSGFAMIETKLTSILDKIDALPLDQTLASFDKAAGEAATTLAESRTTITKLNNAIDQINKLVGSEDTQNLPRELTQTLAELKDSVESLGPGGAVQGDLRRTLDELRSALRAFENLSNTIDEKPNSLLFGRESSGDPIPKGPR